MNRGWSRKSGRFVILDLLPTEIITLEFELELYHILFLSVKLAAATVIGNGEQGGKHKTVASLEMFCLLEHVDGRHVRGFLAY